MPGKPIHHKRTAPDSNFERLVLFIAIVEPLSTLPQIFEVFGTRRAGSLSLMSWLLFTSASVIWLIYGLRLKSRPLIASSVLWITTELVLIFGILLYA